MLTRLVDQMRENRTPPLEMVMGVGKTTTTTRSLIIIINTFPSHKYEYIICMYVVIESLNECTNLIHGIYGL